MKFGSRYNNKQLKQIEYVAQAVEDRADAFAEMSEEALTGYTATLRARLEAGETEIDILPDAFAAVREAAWRVLGMRHFHVQIVGGIALYMGKIAEMGTGEGKTLVATLPVYLWALRGKGVHVVTVNEYLASRDSQWMGRIFRYLGLTVGVILSGQEKPVKRYMYNCDITYGVGSEFGFDYLRDNMVKTLQGKVQRPLACALVDEVDSILIDEARTPLIISGAKTRTQDEEEELKMYAHCDAFVRTLSGNPDKQAESKLEQVTRRISGAESESEDDYEVDAKAKTVTLTNKGMDKALSYFRVDDLADVDNLHHILNQCLIAHFIKKRDVDYLVRTREVRSRQSGKKMQVSEIVIIDEFTGRLMPGRRYSDGLHQAIEAKEGVTVRAESVTYASVTYQNYFRLYDTLAGMTGTAKTEEEEFATIYGLSVVCVPPNKPLRRVDENDRVFINHAGKIRALVNEIVACYQRKQPVLVGTVSVERSEELSAALKKVGVPHNVLNAKNHEREAEIIAQAGKIGMVTIATNMAGRGTDILLGGNPEYMARTKTNSMFYKGDYPPQLMLDAMGSGICFSKNPEEIRKFNKVRTAYKANYDAYKAQTDAEKEQVVALGGLRVIGSERHESRRIDNQLRGRSGRQGDPGSSVFFLSFDDDLLRVWAQNVAGLLSRMSYAEDTPVSLRFVAKRIEQAQARMEGANFAHRKQLLEFDNVTSDQRASVYADRDKILAGEDIHGDIVELFPKGVRGLLLDIFNDENMEQWDADRLNNLLSRYLVPAGSDPVTASMAADQDFEGLVDRVTALALEKYEQKRQAYNDQCPEMVQRNLIPADWSFANVERFVMASVVDNKWVKHMEEMDELKEGVSMRSQRYEPVVVYSKEGYELFEAMVADIQKSVVRELMRYDATPTVEVQLRSRSMGYASGIVVDRKGQAVRAVSKVGPNDPCPCGSGKKYKKCHGARS